MKGFNRIIIAAAMLFAVLFTAANVIMISAADGSDADNLTRVEVERLCGDISQGKAPKLSECSYIIDVIPDDGTEEFYSLKGDHLFRTVNGKVYRFDRGSDGRLAHPLLVMNIAIGASALLTFAVLLYIRSRIIKPFTTLSEVPYELSRGNLTIPLKENPNRYFGKFVWGTDMLREKLEEQKAADLELHKEKQTLLLSISHDIKTPLSAISLYSKALARGLYTDPQKLEEVYKSIGDKAAEIEKFISELIHSADKDFLALEVDSGECYLSEIVSAIKLYYSDKLAPLHTKFTVGEFTDCIIKCDKDRAIEVLQNLMENAVKYGDGGEISLSFSDEEDHRLITVRNSGCTLPEEELPHIFDSFWRGSNVGSKPGSGLGLYICRQLMMKMGGDIFARTHDGYMDMTAVFMKA